MGRGGGCELARCRPRAPRARRSARVREAAVALDQERDKWAELEEAKDPALNALFEEARLAITRAAATKLEVMLCLVFDSKRGKGRAKRISEHTASFVHENKQEWQQWVHPEIKATAEQALLL